MITHRLLNKGDIAPGFDADIVLADPHETFIARAAASESRQGSGTHARQQIFALRGRSDPACTIILTGSTWRSVR